MSDLRRSDSLELSSAATLYSECSNLLMLRPLQRVVKGCALKIFQQIAGNTD